MNFDVLVTLMVAISTYQTGMCYPKDRTKANPPAEQDLIATIEDDKWRRPMESFKFRNIPSIRKVEHKVSKFNMRKRKRRITKGSTENDERVYLEIVDKIKEAVHCAVKSLSRLRRNEISPSNIVIPPEKLDTYLRNIMNSFKIKASMIPYTTNNNWGYEDEDEDKKTIRTIAPKKLKLLKALLKRFGAKPTTDFSKILYKHADPFAMKTATFQLYSRGPKDTTKSFLSLKEFDDIFTRNYDTGLLDILENDRLKKFTLINPNLVLDSESSFAGGINEITTKNYKPIVSNLRCGDNKKNIVGTSLNALAEKNVTKFMTKLKNSQSDILPATPITLILNDDNDDILISNNTMILPIPVLGKYVRKDIGKSKLFNSAPITPEDRKISDFNMSKWSDMNKTKSDFNDLNTHSSIPFILRGPNLLQSNVNGSVFPILTNVGEDQTKLSVGKNISLIKVLINYNSSDTNVTEQAIKLHPVEDHSAVIKYLSQLEDPFQESFHPDSKVSKTVQGSGNASLPSYSRINSLKKPNIIIQSYNISQPNNTSIHRIRKIWEDNIFSENPLNRLYEMKRFLNGTDEFIAIPFEIYSNEYIHLLPTHTDNLEDKGVNDQLFSDQLKMSLEKYVHDREDTDDPCNAKHTTRHHGHRKIHPTRFGMHIDSKHIATCSRCSKCSNQDETENTDPFCQDESYIFEEDMPEPSKSSELDIEKWKCTCKKISQEMEHVRYKTGFTEKWTIQDTVNHPVSTSTATVTATATDTTTATATATATATDGPCTMKIYDEEEIYEDYLMDTTKSEFSSSEKPKENNKSENVELPNFLTHRPVEAQGFRHCCMTTCSCKTKNPTVTGPSRQDIIVSIMCGRDNCTECTMCTTNGGDDSLKCFPEKIKIDSCTEEGQKALACEPLEVSSPLSQDEGPTICTKPPALTICSKPVTCSHILMTKKRRCTCACFCKTPKKSLFGTKSRNHGKNRKNHLDTYPHLIQGSWNVENISLSNKKSTEHFRKLMHISNEETSSVRYKPLETYYTVTDINLIDYIFSTTVHDASNETENKDETDPDYWVINSSSDSYISLTTNLGSFESSTERIYHLPQTTEQNYETICINIKPSTVGRRCSCSRKKVRSTKNCRNHKIHCNNLLEETKDNYNGIESKYVGKYKTFGLDSSEIIKGLNHNTPILENIIPGYKQVTRFNDQNKATPWFDIENITVGYEGMDLYPTDSPTVQMTTQDYGELMIQLTETTPHSLLSPRERITLSTIRKQLHNHHEIRAFLSSNNLRKPHVKNSMLKSRVYSTNRYISTTTRKKTHFPTTKCSSLTLLLEKVKQKSHLFNEADKARPTTMRRLTNKKTEFNASMESESISQPKVIVKNSDIASVKIVFGTNRRENSKKSKKKRFNGTKKFFSFETKL